MSSVPDVAQVRRTVEAILRSPNTGKAAAQLATLSTDPTKLDPGTAWFLQLREKCWFFAGPIAKRLSEAGIEARAVGSKPERETLADGTTRPWRRGQGSPHGFVEITGTDIVVDPTLGQFVYSHPHVFVGTKQELRDLYLRAPEDDRCHHRWVGVDPVSAFEQLWGSVSPTPTAAIENLTANTIGHVDALATPGL